MYNNLQMVYIISACSCWRNSLWIYILYS